jgi:hypothetical protein
MAANKPSKSTASEDESKDVTPAAPTQQAPQNPAQHDETDVAAALQRKTQDGKGDEEVPESDFQSFATEGVEKKDLLSVEEVTQQVLSGLWGPMAEVAEQRLRDAGYNVAEVGQEFDRRKRGGAPSAF